MPTIFLLFIYLIPFMAPNPTFGHNEEKMMQSASMGFHEVKIAVKWRHVADLSFWTTFESKNGEWNDEERFEFNLFKVSYDLEKQFGRANGHPIGSGKTAHYDVGTLRIAAQELENEQNEKGNGNKGKGKAIEGEGIEGDSGVDKFELRIKMIFGGIWNRQVVTKRLKTLPNANQILVCQLENNRGGCDFIDYHPAQFHRPIRQIFFELNLQSPLKHLLERIECAQLPGEFLDGLQFFPTGVIYNGPICPQDAYILHLLITDKYKYPLPYNCDEAIYENQGENVYHIQNNPDGTFKCKLRLKSDAKSAQELAQEIEKNEGEMHEMERQIQKLLWKFFYKQIYTTKLRHQQLNVAESSFRNSLRNNQVEAAQRILEIKKQKTDRQKLFPMLHNAIKMWQNFFLKGYHIPQQQNAANPLANPDSQPQVSPVGQLNLDLFLGQTPIDKTAEKTDGNSADAGASSSGTNPPQNQQPETQLSQQELSNLTGQEKMRRIHQLIGQMLQIVPTQGHLPLLQRSPSSRINQFSQLFQSLPKALHPAAHFPHQNPFLPNPALNAQFYEQFLKTYQTLSSEASRKRGRPPSIGASSTQHQRPLEPKRPKTPQLHHFTEILNPERQGEQAGGDSDQPPQPNPDQNPPVQLHPQPPAAPDAWNYWEKINRALTTMQMPHSTQLTLRPPVKMPPPSVRISPHFGEGGGSSSSQQMPQTEGGHGGANPSSGESPPKKKRLFERLVSNLTPLQIQQYIADSSPSAAQNNPQQIPAEAQQNQPNIPAPSPSNVQVQAAELHRQVTAQIEQIHRNLADLSPNVKGKNGEEGSGKGGRDGDGKSR